METAKADREQVIMLSDRLEVEDLIESCDQNTRIHYCSTLDPKSRAAGETRRLSYLHLNQ